MGSQIGIIDLDASHFITLIFCDKCYSNFQLITIDFSEVSTNNYIDLGVCFLYNGYEYNQTKSNWRKKFNLKIFLLFMFSRGVILN
jgi:hypothetical protein